MKSLIASAADKLSVSGRTILSGLPTGLASGVLPELLAALKGRDLIHVCVDDQQLANLEEQLLFHAPKLAPIRFPAWDCLPYDRVSPAGEVIAGRLAALSAFAAQPRAGRLILTTVNAITQRVVGRDVMVKSSLTLRPGARVKDETLRQFLTDNGYSRVGTVVDPGDFAVRGSLVDIYPPGCDEPVRLDFFGDTLESIRTFDVTTQRTTDQLKQLVMNAANEVLLQPDTVARFRQGYATAFGGIDTSDPLYESVTGLRRYQGVEHWMPLFHEKLETLFDYLPEAAVTLAHTVVEAITARKEQIEEAYNARKEALNKKNFGAAPYKPLPPSRL
jgi:transcription-repair coupling factor (superfamily II helicase)